MHHIPYSDSIILACSKVLLASHGLTGALLEYGKGFRLGKDKV